MNIPMKAEPQPFMQTGIGNAAIGGAPNRPFQVEQKQPYLARYAEESYNFPRFNEYWKQVNQSTYNPITPTQVNTHHMGNAANGCNQPKGMGAGKKPLPWRAGPFRYDKNSSHLEGGNKYVWNFGFNVNEGEPLDLVKGQQEVVDQLIEEMADEGPIQEEQIKK